MNNITSNTEADFNNTSNKIKSINKKPEKNCCTIIKFLIITILILIIAIALILAYFLLIKKEKKCQNIEKENNIESKNTISASYIIKEGKEMSLINPDEIGLKKEDYSIEEIEIITEDKSNLRFLKNIIAVDNKYTPKNSGILSALITFKNNLNSLDGLFKDNKEIIKVNLNNFNMNDVVSMKSTFSGCTHLSEINLEGVNSSKLTKMENTFENCTELKNINLSPLNTTNIIYMNNIFSGCNHLETINLSSFNKVNSNIFNGIQSQPSIIANKQISNDLSNIFYNLFSVKINIIIANDDETKNCTIGENEKCKSCSKKIKSNCLTCNEGYYLPYHEMENKICLPCNIISHCSSCFGEKNYVICLSCNSGYILSDNKCIEKEKEIPICLIGENEKCKTCNIDPKLRNQCETCNDGYYIAEEEKTICQKCNLEGCLKCNGPKNNQLCLACQNGYNLINNICIKEKCVIGENEKCSSCKNESGKEKECATCNDGYYILENSSSYICSKCSIKNCKKCSMNFQKEICLECNTNFTETRNLNGTIENCICPSDHRLINDLCLRYENWIEMEYNVTDYNIKSKIMNTLYTNIQLNELDLYINNSIVPITKEFDSWDKSIFYKFEKNGIYTIKMNIKKTLYSMAWMFTNLRGIKSIKFLRGFDSSKVTSMNEMFAYTSIEYINMKYLDTRNLKILSNFLSFSNSITSLDLSNFNTSNTYEMRQMFSQNSKLNVIDLSSFNTSKVENCLVMFHDLPINCTIKISNEFTKCREQIRYENKIINVDDLACANFENCEKCGGSKETLFCLKCKIGYQFINNKCIKPKCDLGEKEKCSLCQDLSGKENECLDCNIGYYLPLNMSDKTKCSKCQIEGCQICDNIFGNCQECMPYYEPIIDKETGLIKNCKLKCEIGSDDKCLTCETEKGKESKCASCNSGYKLVNGKCKIIENSFIGIYNVTSTSKYTRIMCVSENNIKLSDFDMYVNGKKVVPYIDQGRWRSWMDEDYVAYVFPTLGKNEVKIIFNKTLTDMKYLFVDIYDLISIDFNEAFDTSHVLCMYYMFSSCDSLQHINVSSFNTSLVGDMEGMFTGCDSLTSLNLSNFDTKNVDYMQCIFSYSENLSFLDISSFDTTYLAGGAWMFEELAEKGTVIIGKKFDRKNSLPEGWTIIYKN